MKYINISHQISTSVPSLLLNPLSLTLTDAPDLAERHVLKWALLSAPLQKSSAFLLPSNGRNGNLASLDGVGFSEGELLLKVQDLEAKSDTCLCACAHHFVLAPFLRL